MEEAVRNVTPALEVKSRRVGGATYQVPIEVPPRRGRTLAIRWIVRFARERREKQMSERLANELLDALGSQGAPSSGRTTSTGWLRRTRRSRTTAGRGPVRSRELRAGVAGRGPSRRAGRRARAATRRGDVQ